MVLSVVADAESGTPLPCSRPGEARHLPSLTSMAGGFPEPRGQHHPLGCVGGSRVSVWLPPLRVGLPPSASPRLPSASSSAAAVGLWRRPGKMIDPQVEMAHRNGGQRKPKRPHSVPGQHMHPDHRVERCCARSTPPQGLRGLPRDQMTSQHSIACQATSHLPAASGITVTTVSPPHPAGRGVAEGTLPHTL